MSDVLADFVRALRASDVRVSISETKDAGDVVEVVGFGDRATLKHALGQVLAKTEDEKQTFDATFDRYFAFDQFKKSGAGGAEDGDPSGDAAADGEASESSGDDGEGQQRPGEPTAGSPMGGGMGGDPEAQPADGQEQDLIALLERGDPVEMQMALADGARRVGLNRIRLFTQRGSYTRRIMEEMGLDGMNREIGRAEEQRTGAGDARADYLRGLREGLREEVRNYVEKQLEIFTANAGKQLREEVLSSIRLSNLDRRDMRLMREMVRKMAKKLVAMHARRKKVDIRGHLDVRRTIRANIEFDGLLFHTIWKQKKIDQPKVMAICDVSGSVAQYSRFLLMFLYSLQEVLPKVRSFCFSSDLGEVTEMFASEEIEKAINIALRDHGNGSTDYGKAFEDFERKALDDVDHRTTVIILGDARSNYGDPRSDILKKVHERSRRVIWLNPEVKSMWGTGDSEMKKLTPYTDKAITCASLKDLERVVSDLLRNAS